MKVVYVKDGVVVSHVFVNDALVAKGIVTWGCSIPGVTEVDVADDNPVVDGWTANVDGSFTPPAPQLIDDVPTFLLRIPPASRIAIRASTDAGVVDFLALLNDPRTQAVNRSLPSVQQAIEYMTTVGTPPLLSAADANTILTAP